MKMCFFKILIVNWGEIVLCILCICEEIGIVIIVVYLIIDCYVFYV